MWKITASIALFTIFIPGFSSAVEVSLSCSGKQFQYKEKLISLNEEENIKSNDKKEIILSITVDFEKQRIFSTRFPDFCNNTLKADKGCFCRGECICAGGGDNSSEMYCTINSKNLVNEKLYQEEHHNITINRDTGIVIQESVLNNVITRIFEKSTIELNCEKSSGKKF